MANVSIGVYVTDFNAEQWMTKVSVSVLHLMVDHDGEGMEEMGYYSGQVRSSKVGKWIPRKNTNECNAWTGKIWIV